MRRVIGPGSIRSLLCTEATTTSSRSSSSSVWSRPPSSRMSTSMPRSTPQSPVRPGGRSRPRARRAAWSAGPRSARWRPSAAASGRSARRTRGRARPRSSPSPRSATRRRTSPSGCAGRRAGPRAPPRRPAASGPAPFSRSARYDEVCPPSVSTTTASVALPIPSISRSAPVSARRRTSSSSRASRAAAARRNALTLKVSAWRRSSRNAMRRSAATGSPGGSGFTRHLFLSTCRPAVSVQVARAIRRTARACPPHHSARVPRRVPQASACPPHVLHRVIHRGG